MEDAHRTDKTWRDRIDDVLHIEPKAPLKPELAALAVAGIVAAGALSYFWGRKKTEAFVMDIVERGRNGDEEARAAAEKISTKSDTVGKTTARAFMEEATFRSTPLGVNNVLQKSFGSPLGGTVAGSALFGLLHEGDASRKADAAFGGMVYSGVYALGEAIGGSQYGPVLGLVASTFAHAAHNVGCDHGVEGVLSTTSTARTTDSPKKR